MTVFHCNRHSVKTHRETDSGYRKTLYSLTDQYPEKPTVKDPFRLFKLLELFVAGKVFWFGAKVSGLGATSTKLYSFRSCEC